MSALDELFSKCSAFNYCHETRDEYATHADAVMLAIGPARAELAALREEIARLAAKVEKADRLNMAAVLFHAMVIGESPSLVEDCHEEARLAEAIAAYRSAP